MRLLSKGQSSEAKAPEFAEALEFYQSWEKRLEVAAGIAAGTHTQACALELSSLCQTLLTDACLCTPSH